VLRAPGVQGRPVPHLRGPHPVRRRGRGGQRGRGGNGGGHPRCPKGTADRPEEPRLL